MSPSGLADIDFDAEHVCFWGQSGHDITRSHGPTLPCGTQSAAAYNLHTRLYRLLRMRFEAFGRSSRDGRGSSPLSQLCHSRKSAGGVFA
jgi:hypothetical protein